MIVHSGLYEVDRAHSALMRRFVLLCFLHLLGGKAFKRMVGKDDLNDWFDARMRGEADEKQKKMA